MRLSLLIGVALALFAGTRGQAGDEPVMGGKTAGQWIAIFQDKNRSWAERQQAIETIGYFGPAARSAVPCLIQAINPPTTGEAKLDQTNAALRHLAAEALGRIGPEAAEAIPKLFPKTGDGRFENGQRHQLDFDMERALGRIGRPAVPALIQALQSKDLEVRIFAVDALELMQDDATEAVPALIAALDAPSFVLRGQVVEVLGRIGPPAALAVPALKAKLSQERFGADYLLTLERIGKAAVPVLVEIFQRGVRDFLQPEDSPPGVGAFLRLGTEAREAAPALRPYLTDKRPMIRAAATVALGAVAPDTPGIVPALIEILKYPSPDSKNPDAATPEQRAKEWFGAEAALVLAWIGPPARSALPVLLENLKEQEEDEDSFWNKVWPPVPGLIGIMIRIDPGSKLVIPPLLRAIRRGDGTAMLEATMLEPIPKIVLKALTQSADDDEADVREIEMVAHRIGTAAAPAVPALIEWLEGEIDGGFAAEALDPNGGFAAEALGAIGPAAKEAVPALERRLKVKEGAWMCALIALLQIDPTNRTAKEFLASQANTLPLHLRAILAGTQGKWSPEGEALTREMLFRRNRRGFYSSYDYYSPGLCDPYCGVFEVSQYGPGARAAVPVLTKLLTHRDRFVRRWAADALRRIEGRPAPHAPVEQVTQPVH